MSNIDVNIEILDDSANWLVLAEDAELEAGKAAARSRQLKQAAKIFRQKAQEQTPFPQSKETAVIPLQAD